MSFLWFSSLWENKLWVDSCTTKEVQHHLWVARRQWIHRCLYAVHLSLKQQSLGEILHPKKKKFTLIFDRQEYIRTHRCLFCSSSLSETTDYKWICAPQKKTIGHFWHHKKRKSPSSFSGRNALNSHWYISLQFISLWHNRLQVNSCNIQKMNFTVIFQWQEYISVNLRTISMIEKNKIKNSFLHRQTVSECVKNLFMYVWRNNVYSQLKI